MSGRRHIAPGFGQAVSCLVILGVLIQAALALPVSLRMAPAAFGLDRVGICSAGHVTPAPDQPVPAHHHTDCPLCHLPVGPALLAVALLLPMPTASITAAAPSSLSRPGPVRFPASFPSRAPPALA